MDELHLFIYGEIGEGFFDEGGISVENIQKKLTDNPEAKEVIVHISSPGGSVFDGWTIGNIIKNSGKKTVAKIEGLCASIATFVALSCDRVEMAETARFMIHNPSTMTAGEEDDLKEEAEQLATIKDDLIKTYKDKTNLPTSELSVMMDKETILTAQEAKKMGFVDDFMTPLKAVAYYKTKEKMLKVETPKAKELDSLFDKLLAKSERLMEKLFPKDSEHNVMVTLADGSSIFIDSEDGEFEGKRAWTVDEAGNPTETPVENGTFALEDGRSITVEDGIVLSVQESEPEEVDLLKSQIAKLEKEAKDNEKEKEASVKDAKETKESLAEVITEVQNLQKLTVGDKGPVKKRTIETVQNKFNKDEQVAEHPMDAFAASLKYKKSR